MAAMTEEQREFWRALTAPFPRDSYLVRDGANGKKFTYLKSRTIMNRLDDVVGPGNWDVSYVETSRGIICTISIDAPPREGSVSIRVSKSGGGGFKQMQDDDSSYKTGFSSAFKTAAAGLGIGRELYGDGMPAYCADLHGGNASGMPADGPGAGPPPRGSKPSGNGQQNGNGNGNGNGQHDLKPPYGKTGKAPFAWGKKASEHFQIDVLGRMIDYAKKRKKPERTDQWDEGFLDECLAKTVGWLKTLENYNGEFGEASPREEAPAAPAKPAQGQPHSLVAPITAAVNALIHKQTGRDATPGEIVACIQELATSVPNGQNVRGEVMQSLRNCQDGVWLKRILDAANKRIQEVAVQSQTEAPVDDDDIPF